MDGRGPRVPEPKEGWRPARPERVRVLVVDDSAFMRQALTRILSAAPEVEVVGTARDGAQAVERTLALRPDVVTLDVEMPVRDGLSALREIMARCPTPVVMVSSLTRAQAETTVEALHAGAVDCVAKPSGTISLDIDRVAEELLAKVCAAARASVARSRPDGWARRPAPAPPPPSRLGPHAHGTQAHAEASGPPGAPRGDSAEAPPAPRGAAAPAAGGLHVATRAPAWAAAADGSRRLLVVGASTGGPRALGLLLPALPEDLPTPVVVVQHMPVGFTRALAERLDRECRLRVREARGGEVLTPGVALVAPGGRHLVVRADGGVVLDAGPPRHGVRPAVDVTLESAAAACGAGTVAVILTGMGMDGALGAQLVRRAGGRVLAEAEESCVVYGMPRAVVEMGCADRVAPLDALAGEIVAAVSAEGALRP